MINFCILTGLQDIKIFQRWMAKIINIIRLLKFYLFPTRTIKREETTKTLMLFPSSLYLCFFVVVGGKVNQGGKHISRVTSSGLKYLNCS